MSDADTKIDRNDNRSRDDGTDKKQTDKMFSLVAFSFISATLMGSSIGLAIVQSHRFEFLKGSLFSQDLSVSPLSSVSTTRTTTTSDAMTTTDTMTLMTVIHRMAIVLCWAWIPLLVWLLSLALSSIWTRQYFTATDITRSSTKNSDKELSRGGPTTAFTPRIAMLTSHILFMFFWVIFAALQENEEQRWTKINGSDNSQAFREQHQPSNVAQTSSSSFSTTTPPSTIAIMSAKEALIAAEGSKVLLFPLRVVCLLAIVILGLATGMLTASSSILEKQMAREWIRQEKMATLTGLEPGSSSLSLSSPALSNVVRFSWVQRTSLKGIVLMVFLAQMRFSHWILELDRCHRQSASAGVVVSTTVLSSASGMLILFGLLLGLVMISLGRRCIPPTGG